MTNFMHGYLINWPKAYSRGKEVPMSNAAELYDFLNDR